MFSSLCLRSPQLSLTPHSFFNDLRSVKSSLTLSSLPFPTVHIVSHLFLSDSIVLYNTSDLGDTVFSPQGKNIPKEAVGIIRKREPRKESPFHNRFTESELEGI